MKYDDLIRAVASETTATRAQADSAVVATLTVLAECVGPDETRDLLAQLPKSFKERVPVPAQAASIGVDDFMSRAAQLLGDDGDVERYVRVVFATLDRAVNAGEMRDIAAHLGDEFGELLGRAEPPSSPRILRLATDLATRPFHVVTAVPRTAVHAARTVLDAGVRATRELTSQVGRLTG